MRAEPLAQLDTTREVLLVGHKNEQQQQQQELATQVPEAGEAAKNAE